MHTYRIACRDAPAGAGALRAVDSVHIVGMPTSAHIGAIRACVCVCTHEGGWDALSAMVACDHRGGLDTPSRPRNRILVSGCP